MDKRIFEVSVRIIASDADDACRVVGEQLGVECSNVKEVHEILCHNPSHNKELVKLINTELVAFNIRYGDKLFQSICCSLAKRDYDEMLDYFGDDVLADMLNKGHLSDYGIDVLLNNVCDDIDLATILIFVCRSRFNERMWKILGSVFQ